MLCIQFRLPTKWVQFNRKNSQSHYRNLKEANQIDGSNDLVKQLRLKKLELENNSNKDTRNHGYWIYGSTELQPTERRNKYLPSLVTVQEIHLRKNRVSYANYN